MHTAFQQYITGGPKRAVAFVDLNGDLPEFSHLPDEPMPVASVMKVPLAMALYAGDQNLSQTVRVGDLSPTRFCSVWAAFDADHRLTLAELAHMMLIVSDNPGAVYLERFASKRSVTAFMQGHGCSPHAVMGAGFSEAELGPQGRANTLTVKDAVHLWRMLAFDPLYVRLRDVLVHNLRNNRLAAPLDETVKVSHKTGSLAGVACDVALITTGPTQKGENRQYILACLSDAEPDGTAANNAQAALSAAVYQAVMAS